MPVVIKRFLPPREILYASYLPRELVVLAFRSRILLVVEAILGCPPRIERAWMDSVKRFSNQSVFEHQSVAYYLLLYEVFRGIIQIRSLLPTYSSY